MSHIFIQITVFVMWQALQVLSTKKKSLGDLVFFGIDLQERFLYIEKAPALQSFGEECSMQRGWVWNGFCVL